MLYVGYQQNNRQTYSPSRKNKPLVIIGVVLLVAIILYFILISPLLRVFKEVQLSTIQAKKVSDALKNQDIIQTRSELILLQDNIGKLKESVKVLGWTGYIPFLGSYYNDASHLIAAGEHGSKAAIIISDSIAPFAEALGLKGGNSGNAELYAQKAVQAMPKLLPNADRIEAEVKKARLEIDKVNPNRYPFVSIKGVKVKDSLASAKQYIDAVDSFMPDIKPILQHVPSALGVPKAKSYLILLQNDKELRATGGFITAYATSKIENGQLTPDISSDNIYNLDATLRLGAAPEPIKKYLLQNTLFIRDSNLSPDYKVSATIFDSYYQKSPDSIDVDGVIAIDSELIRSLIAVTGPITLPSYQETFTASPDSECGKGFPDLVCKIEKYTSQNLNVKYYGDRKKILGDLMQALLKKVMSSPKDKFQPLFNTFLDELTGKHIMFYSYDPNVQALIEKYNYGGRIKDVPANQDYLHINQSNFGGGKSNGYIQQEVEMDYQVAKDGTVNKVVTVKIKNTGKYDEHLNTGYKNWMRLYVPLNSSLGSSDVQGQIETLSDLNKSVFANFSKTDPGKTTVQKYTYKLPFKVSNNSDLKVLIQKQPGTIDMPIVVKLNGKEIQKFDLTTDKEISFKVKL